MPVKKATEALPNILLRKARQERGWSQKDLADLIGVPQPFMISRWENGTAYPGPGYRAKLSSIFGKPYEELGLLKSTPLLMPVKDQTPIIDPAIPTRQPGALALTGRARLLGQVKQHLLSRKNSRFIGINGLPGAGKTALAMELSTTAEIQDYFQDGVLWATLGPQPDLCMHLRRWGHLLGLSALEATSFKHCHAWIQELHQAIGSRRMLLVLDDVWNIEDALACMVGGPYCAYLLTTRIPEVATRFAGEYALQLPELTLDEGIQLLRQIIPTLVEKEWDAVYQLIQAAGGLPLTLTAMGNYLLVQIRHRQQRRIQNALKQLQQPKERMRLVQPATSNRNPNSIAGIQLSIQEIIGISETLLDEASRQALYALSVFPAKPATFSEEAALAVAATSRDTLDRLVDSGLIECNENDRYQLHQSIVDYAQTQSTTTQAERRLIIYVLNYVRRHQQEEPLLEQENSIILAALKIASQREYQAEFVECAYSLASIELGNKDLLSLRR